jgi:hypothetical protein
LRFFVAIWSPRILAVTNWSPAAAGLRAQTNEEDKERVLRPGIGFNVEAPQTYARSRAPLAHLNNFQKPVETAFSTSGVRI